MYIVGNHPGLSCVWEALSWILQTLNSCNLQQEFAKRITMHPTRKHRLCFHNVNVKAWETTKNIWSITHIIQFKQFRNVCKASNLLSTTEVTERAGRSDVNGVDPKFKWIKE